MQIQLFGILLIKLLWQPIFCYDPEWIQSGPKSCPQNENVNYLRLEER